MLKTIYKKDFGWILNTTNLLSELFLEKIKK